MLELRLSVSDLAATWFAYSPLQETVFSVRALIHPGVYASRLPWHDDVAAFLNPEDDELLRSLMAPRRWLPDFITPRPAKPVCRFADELANLRATPPDVVWPDILVAYGTDPVPAVLTGLADDPAALRDRVATVLERYWRRCVRPWWPRMQAILESDITYRARRLARGGAQALFADLDERLRWHDAGVLTVRQKSWMRHQVVEVGGRGLPLLPSLFARGAMTLINPTGDPVISYPARGRAILAEHVPPPTVEGLSRLVGSARATLLGLLEQPAGTTELAYRLGVTPAAVSQQLTVLHAAGLLTKARSGRSVLYTRSPLGDRLVAPRH